jgi:hypothetical protein
MRRMIPDDLYDFILIGAGVLFVSVLIAHGPFTGRPRHPMLFGILSAAFIMAVYLLAHLIWMTRGEHRSRSSKIHARHKEKTPAGGRGSVCC